MIAAHTTPQQQFFDSFYDNVIVGLADPASPLSEVLAGALFLWIQGELRSDADRKSFDDLCHAGESIETILGFAAGQIDNFQIRSQEILLDKIAELEAQAVQKTEQMNQTIEVNHESK